MLMHYKAITFVKRPTTDITPDTFETITLETPALKEGEFLVKQTHMSLDPAMRTWMQDNPSSYIPPVAIGEVMRAFGVGEVVESKNPAFTVGARVVGVTGWAEYVLGGPDMQVVPAELPVEALLCVLHVPGLTAYVGLMEIARPKAGETLVVSGAAGSVGSLVGQMAKAEGLRVVGIAGSEEKCRWLVEELGFDAALNYRSANLAAELAEATPNGVDVYFENTGGAAQHLVFDRLNRFGRVTVCGMIADYSREVPAPGPSWVDINIKALRVEGFVIVDHYDKIPQATQALSGYLQKGQLKYRAHVLKGLDSAIDGVNLLFSGENKGKLLVEL
ncbi:NADP-dependent oxidoreductase [Pseudomonas alkylphenolica]|uniref:NADP-dependent oxidoreductase n=1 Tax=Pseudomonas alkylphenolica TaxID=237609 RepID=A0A077F8G6_9PSED|nr:NADP-dependent oxidoreductase [Pseudomonas alkylphenolica]AIL61757.1 NADP-dependent oxidoreductase [Pseudomonas alkylphenolica]